MYINSRLVEKSTLIYEYKQKYLEDSLTTLLFSKKNNKKSKTMKNHCSRFPYRAYDLHSHKVLSRFTVPAWISSFVEGYIMLLVIPIRFMPLLHQWEYLDCQVNSITCRV